MAGLNDSPQSVAAATKGMGMDPVTIGIGAASTIAGVLGGIFGGSDQVDPNAKQLPYEYEIAMLENFNKGIADLDTTQKQFETATQEYKNRLDLIDSGLKNLIPSADLQKQLAESSLRLAQALGQSGEDLVKNGFLTEADVQDMNQLKALEDKTSVELAQTDPAIQRERQILTQRLQRQGITGAALEQALRDFDVKSGETIKNEKFKRGSDLLSMRSTLRQQGFQQATGSLSATQSELGRIQGVYGQQSALAGERYSANANLATFRTGLVGTRQDLYDKLGKYTLSGRVTGDLAAGRIGTPGKTGTGFSSGYTNQGLDANNPYAGRFVRESNDWLWSRAGQAKLQNNLAEKTAMIEELRQRGAWSESIARTKGLL